MTDKELYEKCQTLGFLIKRFHKQFVSLLPEVERRQLYLKHDMYNIFEFASKLACLSHETVRRVLRLDTILQSFPILHGLFKSSTVSWSKLEIISHIATLENEQLLAEKVISMSQPALIVLVQDIKKQQEPININVESQPKQTEQPLFVTEPTVNATLRIPEIPATQSQPVFENFSMKLNPANLSQLKVLKLKLEKKLHRQLTANELINEMIDIVSTAIDPKPRKTHKSIKQTRYIQAQLKRETLAKTNNLCSIKDCNKPATVIRHKTPYAISHNHDSITTYCDEHHEIEHHSLLHETGAIILQKPQDSPRTRIDEKYQKQRQQALIT